MSERSGTQQSGYGPAEVLWLLAGMGLGAATATWIRPAISASREVLSRWPQSFGPSETDLIGGSTANTEPTLSIEELEPEPHEPPEPVYRTVQLQVGVTNLPQYIRLVDFLQDVDDWASAMSQAIPTIAEELNGLVQQCRGDLASIQHEDA